MKVCPSNPLSPTRVIIADDRATYRLWLQTLFQGTLDIQVVGSVENGAKAVKLSMCLKPDVVVMDVAMPLLDGLAATRRISEFSPAIRVLILSAHAEGEYMEEAMRCGASGYVVKQSNPSMVIHGVREVQQGRSYFDPPLTGSLKNRCGRLFARGNRVRREAGVS